MPKSTTTSEAVPVRTHIPCPDQITCKSSDAATEYSDGHTFCFSCGVSFGGGPNASSPPDDSGVTYEYLAHRKLTKETLAFYGILTKIDSNGKPISDGFPYGQDAYKIRLWDEKKFYVTGDFSHAGLFGMDKFSAGSARAITITEGEYDAPSVFQMLGSKYPAVSVKSASQARKDCIKYRDYINSFDKIYLCFDNDKPGETALREVASLFDFNKVYHVKMTEFKDANEYLQKGKETEFRNLWYNARRFLPEGIISGYEAIDSFLDNAEKKSGTPFPYETLNNYTGGLKTGKVYLVTALEGVGKTAFMHSLEYNIFKNLPESQIGIIHLEETVDETVKGIVTYELKIPLNDPEAPVPIPEIKNGIRKVIGPNGDRVHFYGHFGSDDPDVFLDTVRFLVSIGCKYVFIDHITMVVSGLKDEDERRALDYISTRLAMMVKELDFCLVMVSHVNDDRKTRGSRNISKVAAFHVHLERDQLAESLLERSKTKVTIFKNRLGGPGKTGPAGILLMDPDTGCLSEYNPEHKPELPA